MTLGFSTGHPGADPNITSRLTPLAARRRHWFIGCLRRAGAFVIGGILATVVSLFLTPALERRHGLMAVASVLVLLVCYALMTAYGAACLVLVDVPVTWTRRNARWPSLWVYALILSPAQLAWWDIVNCRDASAALDRQYLLIIAAAAPALPLLTAVWSLLRFQDDLPGRNPRGRSLSFALLLAEITVVGTAVVVANPSRPPLSFHWDFSVRHDSATVNWPAPRTTRFTATLLRASKRRFSRPNRRSSRRPTER